MLGRVGVRSLPIEQWPPADRDAWVVACRPSRRLIRGGAGAHMKPITLSDLARRYGYFLDFLDRTARLDRNAKAAGQVTPGNVAGYIEELGARVSSVTGYGSIYKLRRTSQLLNPSGEFGWLIELEKDLALVMQPRSKADRFVLSEVLVECGLTLMTEAESSGSLSRLAKARQFRNGLMIAMLALHPIRLKNFASLEIGHDFVKIDDQWWIVLSSTATKEARPDERRIDETIAPALGKYLSKHRPVLAGESDKSGALWIPSEPGALTSNQSLIQWLPKKQTVAELLAATDAAKSQEAQGGNGFKVRVTYQVPTDVTWNGTTMRLCGRTLEEAFGLENAVVPSCGAKACGFETPWEPGDTERSSGRSSQARRRKVI
jgi:hypothetical protein